VLDHPKDMKLVGNRDFSQREDVFDACRTMAHVPQVADAVKVPSSPLADIGDALGVWAFALGAAAVQRNGLLAVPKPKSPFVRDALKNTTYAQTTLTKLFTGRPARAILNELH